MDTAIRLALPIVMIMVIVIGMYQTISQNRQSRKTLEDVRLMTADSVILGIASTLAAPHLSRTMTTVEATDTVKSWIPVAREVVRTYHKP